MMYDHGSVMDVIITEVPQWLLMYVLMIMVMARLSTLCFSDV